MTLSCALILAFTWAPQRTTILGSSPLAVSPAQRGLISIKNLLSAFLAATYLREWKETMQEAVCSYWEVKLFAENADQLDLDVGKYEETHCGKGSST